MFGSNQLHKLSGKASTDFNFTNEKLILVGAGGWLGSATLDLLNQHFKNLSNQVYCFGSTEKDISLIDGTVVKQRSLSDLATLQAGKNYSMLNFAFSSPGKITKGNVKNYVDTNRSLSQILCKEARRLEINNVTTISSGSVYEKGRKLVSDIKKNTYGVLKLEEEALFSELINDGMCVVIPRLFNVSGPYINNYDLYMLSSLIWQMLTKDTVKINSSYKVIRSFIAISDLVSVVLGIFSEKHQGKLFIFDTAGEEEVEIGELALKIKKELNSSALIIRDEIEEHIEERYVGSRDRYHSYLSGLSIQEMSIEHQIFCTSEYLRSLLKNN